MHLQTISKVNPYDNYEIDNTVPLEKVIIFRPFLLCKDDDNNNNSNNFYQYPVLI